MPKRKARSPEPEATRLYRVMPWLEQAGRGEPGHPLYVPSMQGAGRIDNPEHYRVLYASNTADGAIAERFSDHAVWTDELFQVPSLPGARRALASYTADGIDFLDLDDASALLDRQLRPSDIVTRDRERTRAWSLRVFGEGRWDGVRWWSLKNPDRGAYGLWTIRRLRLLDVTPLTLDHPMILEAARDLNRPIEK